MAPPILFYIISQNSDVTHTKTELLQSILRHLTHPMTEPVWQPPRLLGVHRGSTDLYMCLVEVDNFLLMILKTCTSTCQSLSRLAVFVRRVSKSYTLYEQEAQLMLTTGSTRLAVSRGQQIWYQSTCYI